MAVCYDNVRFQSDSAILYSYFPAVSSYDRAANGRDEEGNLFAHDQGFSFHAQKRLIKTIDNFASMYETMSFMKFAYGTKLKIKQGATDCKVYDRKPVFMTLTVPDQTIDDKEIKAKMFNRLMERLTRSHNLVNYIWKAEKQLNGNIHFHVICDCFLSQDRVRKLWFKYLDKSNCLGSYLKKEGISHASRIVHLNVLPSVSTLKHELAGYFAADRDEDGNLIHKHDREQTVQDVDGRSWGCSDTLNYDPFTLIDVDRDVTNHLQKECIKYKPIYTKKKNEQGELVDDKHVADKYLFRQYKRLTNKGGKLLNQYFNENKYAEPLQVLYKLYHFEKALKAYSPYQSLEEYNMSYHYSLYENGVYQVAIN